MAALKAVIAALLLLCAVPAEADSVTRWRAFSLEASARSGVPLDWIEHVMRTESGGNLELKGRPITSRAGAMGLMQLMPSTWRAMRDLCSLGDDPFDPHDNIVAGAVYLRLMYNRFGYPGLFAAYNAGPGRYAAYLSGGALPAETRNYVVSVTGRPPYASASDRPPSLFAPSARQSVVPEPLTPARSGLFVTLTPR